MNTPSPVQMAGDAALIAACAEFDALEAEYLATPPDLLTDSPEHHAVEQKRNRILDQQDPIVVRIADLPCTSLAGAQAIARSIAISDQELLKPGPGDVSETLTSKLVESLIKMPALDAELIAICGEFIKFDKQQRAVYKGLDALEDDEAAAAATVPIFAHMDALLDRMQALQAQTNDGIAARAASLAQYAGEWAFSFDRHMMSGRLLDYLMRDAAALGGAA